MEFCGRTFGNSAGQAGRKAPPITAAADADEGSIQSVSPTRSALVKLAVAVLISYLIAFSRRTIRWDIQFRLWPLNGLPGVPGQQCTDRI